MNYMSGSYSKEQIQTIQSQIPLSNSQDTLYMSSCRVYNLISTNLESNLNMLMREEGISWLSLISVHRIPYFRNKRVFLIFSPNK